MLWLLTRRISALLVDGEAVLGDLEERGLAGTARGLTDMLALIAARQSRLWLGWRPWVALATLYIPAAGILGCVVSILRILGRLPWPQDSVVTPSYLASVTLWASVATVLWSWSVGLVLARLTRHAVVSVVPVLLGLVLMSPIGLDSTSVREKFAFLALGLVIFLMPASIGLRTKAPLTPKAVCVMMAAWGVILFLLRDQPVLTIDRPLELLGRAACLWPVAASLWIGRRHPQLTIA